MRAAWAAVLLAAGCASVPRTEVIAHRGGTGPDGTVAGCLRSLEMGVRYLELDVRPTRDGEAVILHDPTVDRTTDGSGPVAEMTLAELKRLDAGAKFDSAFRGERIPTVAEVLRAVGPRGVVLLELKVPDAADAVVRAIREEGAFERAVVRTPDRALLRRIRAEEPRVRLGTMSADLDVEGLDLAAFTPLRNELLTPESVARLQAQGVAVWGTNTNDPAVMRRLVAAGVDGIITDRPATLLEILKEGGAP